MTLTKALCKIAAGLSLILSTTASAGFASDEGGTIHNIRIHRTTGTPVLMFTTVPHISPPTCNGNPAIEWAVTLDDFGKSVYSLVLSAQAQHKKVIIHGKNLCEDWDDRESIIHITLAGE
ncbi:hypothetical protein [Photobacterium sp. OFAV2-7]|uniref:hypothetical protein n=1 Tax=Photobacterium sp. OFAV2-7 TaxID=2917748 RepID=UPI001EF433A6|nr:hypothetical protein [Photobacterium sp. OFAV2-7]MCG7587846.1 hypothetical protein [Photobacterium sp. OFAV2-7]